MDNDDKHKDRKEINTDETTEPKHTDIFEKLREGIINPFEESCNAHGARDFIAIVWHDECKVPIIYANSDMVNAMAMIAKLLREFKMELYAKLDTDPVPRYDDTRYR